MLIEKNTAPRLGDIVTIKLSSGEEIVGKLTERTTETVFLAKPVQIVMQPIAPQKMGLAFHPVLGSTSDTATMQFPLAQMSIWPIRTSDDVMRNYIQATTGLMTADQIPSLIQP